MPAARFRRGARPAARAADPDLRLRRRAVRQGRQGSLRPRARAGRRRWSTCRASPATSWCRSAPAATSRCRPAPTIRRSRSTRSASSRASPTASPRSAGRRPASCRRPADGTTPRNLMGFKDGTADRRRRRSTRSSGSATKGRHWMRGGSYLVARRIRIALEHWDRMKVAFQEQTFGRHKYSGAPLGLKNEFDAARPGRDRQGRQPVIAENAHVRLANAASQRRRARSCAAAIPTMTA